MKICTAHLESLSPYFQSGFITTPKKDDETHTDHERRAWADRIHADDNGNVFIPPMALKFAIDVAAKKLGMKIPGKGKSQYGKLFEGGIMVMEGVTLPIKKADVKPEELFLNSDGRRGGGTRVLKLMPKIPKWSGVATFYIVDDGIPNDVFEKHLNVAGIVAGIGQHRPEKGGFCGRFKVNKVEWTKG